MIFTLAGRGIVLAFSLMAVAAWSDPQAILAPWAASGHAQEKDAGGQVVELARGKYQLTAPKGWKKKQPRTRIVQYEFAAAAAEGDKIDGRVTMMGAGGSVKQNIDRWIGQFTQPDGKASKERTRIEKRKVAGAEIHLVDISGTYKDQRGPFAPATMRKDYRMLGAIIVTDGQGQYFVKLYGPKRTIAANEKPFKEMIKSFKAR